MGDKNKINKTNAMRLLDNMNIEYTYQTYECNDFRDGIQIADMLGLEHSIVYKTLVAVSPHKEYYCFIIPIEEELNLKKCAASVNEKSVELIHVSDINKVTGYVRGGCTAIGMKKQYVTRIDTSAEKLDSIVVSGGRLGIQITIRPYDLKRASKGEYADLILDH